MDFVYAWRHLVGEMFFPEDGLKAERFFVFRFVANKLYSLRRKKDIERLYKEGFVLRRKFLILRFIKSEKVLKTACRVSKKATKSAVKRNKIKRWCKEILSQYKGLEEISLNILIIVLEEPKNYENFRIKIQNLLQEMLRNTHSKNSSFSYCLL